jgi:hypothetical protein
MSIAGTALRACGREDLTAALQGLAPLPRKLAAALRAVRRLPEDLHDTCTAACDLVTVSPKAMPRDEDFLTGTVAVMAAAMLAARITRTPRGQYPPAGPLTRKEPAP